MVKSIRGERPRVPPTSLSCMRCQLLGRRKLMCAAVDVCETVPHVFALGPLLLLGWAATAGFFLYAMW